MRTSAPVIPLHPAGAATQLADRGDDDLMLLARAGRMEAFDALIRRHQAAALRVAYRELGDAALAKDVAQLTFIELHRALPRYEPQGKFKAYLLRILLNQCRQAGRRRGAQQRAMDRVTTGIDAALPEDRLLERERRREVDKALHGLSDKLRQVVLLRFAADCSYQDIAEATGIPLGTVKSRLFAAMEELRRRLHGDER